MLLRVLPKYSKYSHPSRDFETIPFNFPYDVVTMGPSGVDMNSFIKYDMSPNDTAVAACLESFGVHILFFLYFKL